MRSVLRRGVWVIAALAALFGLAATAAVVMAGSAGLISTAQVVVTGSPSTSQDTAFTASQYVNQRMATYATVATSDSVLLPAATALGVPPAELAGMVTATVPLDTTVLDLAVVAPTGEGARARADAVQVALAAEIVDLERGSDGQSRVQVQVLNPPGLPVAPVLPSPLLAAVLGLLLGLVVGVLTVLGFYLLRTRLPVAEPLSSARVTSRPEEAVEIHPADHRNAAHPDVTDPPHPGVAAAGDEAGFDDDAALDDEAALGDEAAEQVPASPSPSTGSSRWVGVRTGSKPAKTRSLRSRTPRPQMRKATGGRRGPSTPGD